MIEKNVPVTFIVFYVQYLFAQNAWSTRKQSVYFKALMFLDFVLTPCFRCINKPFGFFVGFTSQIALIEVFPIPIPCQIRQAA